MKKQIKKIPFSPDRFFWAFCKVTRYIGEPVTNKTGDRLITVQTYDTDMATTLKTMLTYAFDVRGVLTNHVDHTKFIIKY